MGPFTYSMENMEKKSSMTTTIVSVVVVALAIVALVFGMRGRSDKLNQYADDGSLNTSFSSDVPGSADALNAINAESSADAGVAGSSNAGAGLKASDAALGY